MLTVPALPPDTPYPAKPRSDTNSPGTLLTKIGKSELSPDRLISLSDTCVTSSGSSAGLVFSGAVTGTSSRCMTRSLAEYDESVAVTMAPAFTADMMAAISRVVFFFIVDNGDECYLLRYFGAKLLK